MPLAADEVCPRCERELDFDGVRPVPHACCQCFDSGLVRVTLPVTDPGFGRAHYCECSPVATRGAAIAGGFALEEAQRESMGIPAIHWQSRIASWRPDNGSPRLAAWRYVSTWPPQKPLLLLAGSIGTGKTHLAAGILHEVRERYGVRGLFSPLRDILARYKATFGADRQKPADGEAAPETAAKVEAEYRRAPLLVIDEFGAEQGTDWSGSEVFALLDARYREMRPTVVTTNMGLADMDRRLRDRFSHASISEIVLFAGESHRRDS